MNKDILRRAERGGRLATAVALVAFAAACTDAGGVVGTNTADSTPPTVKLTQAGTVPDSVVAFQVEVKDNLGIKKITVNVTGGLTLNYDTTFTSPNTDATIPFSIVVPQIIPPGTPVHVTAFALDGALNKSAVDSLTTTVGNVPAAVVSLNSPTSGTVAVLGKSLILSFNARSAVKVKSIGYRTSGSFVKADSSVFASPLPDSASTLDTLAVPSNAPTGPLQVVPFVIDSLGQRTLGATVILNVQAVGSINSAPVVTFSHTPRVEVNDTIHIEAKDQTGITVLGYEVRSTPG
ncbi:MAG: hypothetical protein ACRD3J_09670, partial [Thermoanaerobaculia bacterium]